MSQVTVETAPYRPWGWYVCDWDCREAHLFDRKPDAVQFAKQWGRDCNVGWLAPTYRDGKNNKPSFREATQQVSKTAAFTDHRR